MSYCSFSVLLLIGIVLSVTHAALPPTEQKVYTQVTVESPSQGHHYTLNLQDQAQSRQGESSSCWELVSDGRRLHRQFIVRSVPASSLQECQRECEDVLFNCETIAYGESNREYGLENGTSCDLSDWQVPSMSLRPYATDTSPASGFAIYSRFGREIGPLDDVMDPQRSNRCREQKIPKKKYPTITFASSTGMDDDEIQFDPHPPSFGGSHSDRPQAISTALDSICYVSVFNGRRLGQRYIERSVTVISLDECKLLCTRETAFDCRSFNYRRRGSATNCDLSREDSASLDTSNSYVFFQDSDVEYYQRVGKGQSCYRPYRPGSSSSSLYEPIRPISGSTFTSDCYRRLKSGYRLDSRIVRESINVRGQYECENECLRSRTFLCRSFSFRNINSFNSGVTNCDLSDFEPRELDPVRHLVIDRDADIFERNAAGRNCRETPVTVWNNNRPLKPINQCFIRSKTGIRLDRRTVRYTLSVNSPVECEQECVNAQFFTCRSFSFRYPGSSSFSSSDPYHKAYDNCDLSDIDILSLDPLRDLLEDRLYDTWQRTSYRDCEFANTIGYGRTPSTTAIATSPSDINGITPIGIIHHPNNDPESFHQTVKPIISHTTKDAGYALKGFEYLLPVIPEREDEDFQVPWAYRRPLPKPYSGTSPRGCFLTYRRGFRINPRLVREAIYVRTLAECELECSRTRPFYCQSFHFRYSNLNGGYERNPFNCEMTDVPASTLDRYRGDMIDDLDYELFTKSPYSSCSNGLLGPTGFSSELSPILTGGLLGQLGPSGVALDVTVSGHRCRWGSRCRPHRELGYWYCDVAEDTAININWDYCCQPQSRCGYSDGFQYPWCYVGAELSGQWRPCSDRFAERPYAYLHRQLPPNATELFESDTKDKSPVEPVESNAFDSSYESPSSDEVVQQNLGDGAVQQKLGEPHYIAKSDCHNKTARQLDGEEMVETSSVE